MLINDPHYEGGMYVYTAIFGGINDKLRYRARQKQDISFLAFTDDEKQRVERKKKRWLIQPPVFYLENARRKARAHKILAHQLFKNAQYTLWVDGCLKIIEKDIDAMIEKHLFDADICVFKHKRRKCVYEEVNACIQQNKDEPQVMLSQVERYRREGYPENNGLAETTAVLRRHNDTTALFNELWWKELAEGSLRDQLSFDYVAWKLRIKYNVFPGTCMHSPYFKWYRH
jgi:hypothetical protein